MKTEYFFVRPSSFVRLGEIDIDGEFEYVGCEDFDVEEEKANYLIFEVKYDDYGKERVFSNFVREVITGKKFELDIEEKRRFRTSDTIQTVILKSEELGLYSNVLTLNEIECKPRKLSGLFYHFLDNPDCKTSYCKSLKSMFDDASAYKYVYDHAIDGPSRYLSSQIRKAYKKINK